MYPFVNNPQPGGIQMRAQTQTRIFIVLIAALTLAACGGKPASPVDTQPVPQETYAPVIDPANFVSVIDNPYMPLVPGTTFIYEGKTEKGNEHNEVYVSSETKVILGVTCVVVKDKVMVDGALEEQTLDWYAQDKQGNVWYFGEDSKEYQNGKAVSTEGSWEGGVDGALPGIVMQASPTIGETYRQEYYKGEAEDWAEVLSLTETATVPTGSYKDLLMTNEWSALDNPPVYEHKYYAKGIGFIMTQYVEGGYEMKLIEIRQGE
jgi:hypothetical protein